MASEGEEAEAANDGPPPPPPPRPSYSTMITEAISALIGERRRSHKRAVTNYIKAHYGAVPRILLSAHLELMTDSGEVILVKNDYFPQGHKAPPKRGRGRPPTYEGAVAKVAVGFPGRVGRPKNPRLEPAAAAETTTTARTKRVGKRGRGRPRKVKDAPEEGATAVTRTRTTTQVGKRGRGRPRKVKDVPEEGAMAVTTTTTTTTTPVGKRGRGRPRKVKDVPEEGAMTATTTTTQEGKRGRGRPRKVKDVPADQCA